MFESKLEPETCNSMVTYEFKKKFFDVKGCKELSLPIDDDFARWFAWDWQVWLHDLVDSFY